MKKTVDFLMLTVETGHEYTVSVPESTPAGDLAKILAPLMRKSIVSDVTVRSEAETNNNDALTVRIFNKDLNVIHTETIRQAFMEGAEAEARRLCTQLNGYTWKVQYTD